MIHLVNYNATNSHSISGIDVVCRPPESETVKTVKLYRLEHDAAIDLQLKLQPHAALFTVPEIRTYALIVIGW